MTLQELQNEICACLWSKTLKTKLTECGHIFTEKELLSLAYHFAPTFEERLRLMQLLADHGTTEADHAKRCIAWQKESLEQFKTKGDYMLYELRIKDSPDDHEERYLCDSFETVMEMIDKFRLEYDFAPETELTRYVIQKRKILRNGQPFEEDGMEECIYGAGKVLISVESSWGTTENGPCPPNCAECTNQCIMYTDVCFPPFIEHLSPVRYRSYDGSIQYGIDLNYGRTEHFDSCLIIPINEEVRHSRTFDDLFIGMHHQHILCPIVEAVSVEDLDEPCQEFYHAFAAWLNEQPK